MALDIVRMGLPDMLSKSFVILEALSALRALIEIFPVVWTAPTQNNVLLEVQRERLDGSGTQEILNGLTVEREAEVKMGGQLLGSLKGAVTSLTRCRIQKILRYVRCHY